MKSNKTKRQFIFLFTLFFGLGLTFSCKQGGTVGLKGTSPYETLFSTMYERGMFNGNVLVLKDGQTVYKASFGVKNIDPIDSLDTESMFRLASVSKEFTATAILQLQEKGLLNIDQNIKDFIPELPYEGISVRNLLNHVSGLPDYEALLDKFWKPELPYNDPERFITGNEDIIAMMVEKKPEMDFQPEEKWEYSNTGYVLLATIVARVSGMPFDQYMQEHIFKPAAMNNTVVYNYKTTIDPDLPNRVFGYRTELDGSRIAEDIHYINPAQGDGGIYSSLEDLKKWDRILYTDKIINETSKKEAFSPFVLKNGDTTNYGFGWFLDKSPSGKKVVTHSGGWVGFRTFIYREIEENNSFIILTNNSSNYLIDAVKQVKNMLHDRDYVIPKMAISDTVAKVVLAQGTKEGIETYKSLKESSSDLYDFRENSLNLLGYQLMQMNKNQEALDILAFNNEQFKESANTFDSLGDAYLATGDTLKAIVNFEKAFAMDSTFIMSKEKIEKFQ
jgi:CubicO group peptidase (beta-lactamase class C family)